MGEDNESVLCPRGPEPSTYRLMNLDVVGQFDEELVQRRKLVSNEWAFSSPCISPSGWVEISMVLSMQIGGVANDGRISPRQVRSYNRVPVSLCASMGAEIPDMAELDGNTAYEGSAIVHQIALAASTLIRPPNITHADSAQLKKSRRVLLAKRVTMEESVVKRSWVRVRDSLGKVCVEGNSASLAAVPLGRFMAVCKESGLLEGVDHCLVS